MFKVLISLGLGAAALSAAPAVDYPKGYWERSYMVGQISAVQYSVKIKVGDIEKAQGEVQRIMTEAGASLSGNSWGNYFGNTKGDRSVSFTLEARKADQTAKKLFALGELQTFNTYRQVEESTLREIERKIQDLDHEISSNRESLEKMPIADYMLNSQRKKLNQARNSLAKGLDRATVNVTLMQAAEPATR